MPNDLNAAEQAAAEALWDHWTPLDGDDVTIEDFYDEARAVVAAVENIVAAETLRAEADTLEHAVQSEDVPTMFVVPAHLWLRDRADSRLRAAERQAEGDET